MGTDFNRSCQVESRKVLWVVALVLASVLIVQYFDLPYGDRVLSLFPLGKAYFGSSSANGYGEQNPSPMNRSSPLLQKSEEGSVGKVLGSMIDLNHTDEEDTVVRSVAYGGISALAVAPAPYEASRESYTIPTVNSPYAVSPERSGVSSAPSESVSPRKIDSDIEAPKAAISPPPIAHQNGTSSDEKQNGYTGSLGVHTNSPPPIEKAKSSDTPAVPSVASISDMNAMLLRSRASSFSESPLWPTPADQEVLDARFQIEHADANTNPSNLYAPIYRNLTTFVRSYEIMEQKLKVYIYNDGKTPVFHNPRLRGIYASEGWFMKHMEASSQFLTNNPNEAHLFYLPFSSQLLVDYVYVKDSRSFDDINAFLKNYIQTIQTRHPFWNRTRGADHFLVACHDWAPHETKHLMSNCIRALCNSDIKEGFKFNKDVSLPETNVQSPQNPMRVTGGRPPTKRTILAFFAGKMHGSVRPLLLKHWENKDPDMKIYGPIRKGYVWHMQNSKYCICAKGYEVNSPRVMEAILYGCVPVIVSDNFVPPFFDVLNWESFAVFVLERDIPNLKNILGLISKRRYGVMQRRVEQVRQHFLWHKTPQRFDIFHMILHSIWYNRVYGTSPK